MVLGSIQIHNLLVELFDPETPNDACPNLQIIAVDESIVYNTTTVVSGRLPVTPGTGPLHLAPGVTHTDQPLHASSVVHLQTTGDGRLAKNNARPRFFSIRT